MLWSDRTLPDAIRAAADAGFHAVECHWPFDTPVCEVNTALKDAGLPMLGLNTRRGNVTDGENGLCALPGRQQEARAAISEALAYAAATGTSAVHVMAGRADGPAAHDTFLENLSFAAENATPYGITILIEPLNRHDAPGYFLRTTGQASAIIEDLSLPNVRLMFDCYHVGRTEGDVTSRLRALLPIIGHIQFAAIPDRGPPDHGELDYPELFREIAALGWTRPLGAEYRPMGDTGASLGWMRGALSGDAT